ncbi:IS6 family transposase [Pelagibius litoralis]|uniref:IS6 family transposase n=1 Tax=Pelagibius litoralis TaxID=374515 RepID=UPI00197D73F6|nr:IS6 family transposase [Pelagibius litoralis]
MSPEVIPLAVMMMMYIRYPLSLRQVEDLLFERGIDICHETVRFRWNRFGPMFAAEIRKRRVHQRLYSHWCWHLDEVFVRINGQTHYLWRAVDHEGEVLEVFASKRRDHKTALKFLKRLMKRYGQTKAIVTNRLRSYGAAMKAMGIVARRECGRWLNNRAENSHKPFRRREMAMTRFRDVRAPQKFAAVHASIHNHFNQDRHLNRRDNFKKNRSDAWRSGASWRPERLGSAPLTGRIRFV